MLAKYFNRSQKHSSYGKGSFSEMSQQPEILLLVAILVKITFFTYFQPLVFARVNLFPLKSLRNRHIPHKTTFFTNILSGKTTVNLN